MYQPFSIKSKNIQVDVNTDCYAEKAKTRSIHKQDIVNSPWRLKYCLQADGSPSSVRIEESKCKIDNCRPPWSPVQFWNTLMSLNMSWNESTGDIKVFTIISRILYPKNKKLVFTPTLVATDISDNERSCSNYSKPARCYLSILQRELACLQSSSYSLPLTMRSILAWLTILI